ncbi:hypothetical protein MIMGU_mgv1a015698mg [Erythranthe guttata]|uniref:Uncharacterized protein n=1 Tax=Erythranthe guttata TaxID=4155 RepID=A0A022RN29_ERYGU|nr:hypothetical protein MIMGU_mgv1a015698mg [Erythranthe guttata]
MFSCLFLYTSTPSPARHAAPITPNAMPAFFPPLMPPSSESSLVSKSPALGLSLRLTPPGTTGAGDGDFLGSDEGGGDGEGEGEGVSGSGSDIGGAGGELSSAGEGDGIAGGGGGELESGGEEGEGEGESAAKVGFAMRRKAKKRVAGRE